MKQITDWIRLPEWDRAMETAAGQSAAVTGCNMPLASALAGLALVYLIFPLLCRLAEKTGRTFFACLSTIPFAAFLLDMIVGYFVKGL